MGGCHGRALHSIHDLREHEVDEVLRAHKSLLHSLLLKKKEGRLLFEAYEKVISDATAVRGGGAKRKRSTSTKYVVKLERTPVSYDGLVRHLELPRSDFSRRCCAMLCDRDHHCITFVSFVSHVWNWLTYDKVGLATFAFRMYCSDAGSGELSKDDLMRVLEGNYDLHNRAPCSAMAHSAVLNTSEFRLDEALKGIRKFASADLTMTLPQWHSYLKHHPLVLMPAFQMCAIMRKRICGERFWDVLSERRESQQRKTGEIIDAELVEKMIQRLGREIALQHEAVEERGGGDSGASKDRRGSSQAARIPLKDRRRSSQTARTPPKDRRRSSQTARTPPPQSGHAAIRLTPGDTCGICELKLLGRCSNCMRNRAGVHQKKRHAGQGEQCCMAVESGCGHLFHSSCAEAWLISCIEDKEKEECPICFAPWKCVARERQQGHAVSTQEHGLVVKSASGSVAVTGGLRGDNVLHFSKHTRGAADGSS